MLTLPIPLFGALVLSFLLARLILVERRVGPLACLIGICAWQSLVIALAQHYGFAFWRYVQPVGAILIPATAWLVFVASAVRRLRWSDALHLVGPLATALVLAIAPALLDLLIPALFLGYALAIFLRARRGMDALPLLRLGAGDVPVQVWLVIAVSLGLSAVSDVAIIAVQTLGAGWLQPIVVSVFSSLNLLLIGGLSLVEALRSEPEAADPPINDPKVDTTEEDSAIMARLEALMVEDRPFLDPDLSLQRLSRKLAIPAKPLSAAINRSTGENVSRYINNARIAEAQSRIAAGEPVTTAIYAAGFNTKSNFNREFSRVTGTSPTGWLKAQRSTA